MASINGYQINLSKGRHVFVAKSDGHFYIRFKNEACDETRMRLSEEAGDVLRHLLEAKEKPEKMIVRWVAHMRDTKEEGVETGGWQLVKTGEAPTVGNAS